MKLSVIIPMYNESRVIGDTARALSVYLSSHFDDYELIFVSDGSSDGCEGIVSDLHLPNTSVLSYQQNMGKGYAVRYGMLHATGDIRFFTDSDLAYGTDVIGQFYEELKKKPELGMAVGSRPLHPEGYAGYSFLRKVMSKAYLRVLSILGGLTLSDSQSGCKAYRGDVADRIFPLCEVNRFAFDFETILLCKKLGRPIGEIPVKILHNGESKMHFVRDALRMLRDLHRMKKRIKALKIDQTV